MNATVENPGADQPTVNPVADAAERLRRGGPPLAQFPGPLTLKSATFLGLPVGRGYFVPSVHEINRLRLNWRPSIRCISSEYTREKAPVHHLTRSSKHSTGRTHDTFAAGLSAWCSLLLLEALQHRAAAASVEDSIRLSAL